MSRALAANRPQLYHSLYPSHDADDDGDVMLRMMGMSRALAANRPQLYLSLYPPDGDADSDDYNDEYEQSFRCK